MNTKEIRFYRTNEEYGCFSNFAPYPIVIDGILWPTSEHYFQAMKFEGSRHEETIRKAKSPAIAARLGRDRSKGIRSDWDSVKDDVMRKALKAKFTQHSTLREILLSTGDAKITEHTGRDSYWADGGDGRGKNMLGQLLMELRELLRKEVDSTT